MSVKEALAAHRVSYGPFVKLAEPAVVEIIALAGFDHVVIDMEHGPLSLETCQNLVRAARLRGLAPLIRVGRNDENDILRALDIGAEGVHVPHIDSAEEARRAVAACYYHPMGERGVCRFVRAAEYSRMDKQDYFKAANDMALPVLHIEGKAGIDALPQILGVPGIGVVFLGPYDLSQSCGVPGEVHHPTVVDSMKSAVVLAREQGVAVGTFVESIADARFWEETGVQYICYSVDVGILYDACAAIMSQLRPHKE